MTKFTIQLDDALGEKLNAISRREQRPVDAIVSELVEKALAVQQLRQLRQELRPYAETAGFKSDEDVFRAVS